MAEKNTTMAKGFIVFIIDDDVAVGTSLSALLKVAGYACVHYISAAVFREELNSAQDGCILLDVRMPEIDGRDFHKQLVADGITLPVILMTGHGDIKMAVDAMKEGAVDFIEKPFSRKTIVTSIEAARARPVQPSSLNTLTSEAVARISGLTPREHDVLVQLVTGNPNKVIAFELDISPRTVEIHRARVMGKMQVRNLAQLIRLAIAADIDPDRKP